MTSPPPPHHRGVRRVGAIKANCADVPVSASDPFLDLSPQGRGRDTQSSHTAVAITTSPLLRLNGHNKVQYLKHKIGSVLIRLCHETMATT